jgi:hypothetical protein
MIRYPITQKELEREVDRIAKTWREGAKKKTAAFRKAGRYLEASGSWSKVKRVYIDLQGGKCAYCERQMGRDGKSAIEHDVEHFRPKGAVRKWPNETSRHPYPFSTGEGSPTGYYLLAYNLLNYIAACKKCNSPYKSDFFPVGAKRRTGTDDFTKLAKEKPLLIYPVSDLDVDPEHLITFSGALPTPVANVGLKYRRGRITIDFFGLDTRDELLRERSEIIKAIYVAFGDLRHPDSLRRRAAEQTIRQIEHPRLPHRNCARSFYRLCQANADAARLHFEAVIAYLDSFDRG